ncbi:ankyrin repeat domain-containing protein [Tahibacter amnicola]|uniref:Ankyrin repeat domain-containing protein n=1 Tax=Tahibacter amnicola TaxID=2976241 RepID=A0ABY6BK67_9GAMM|nr:ankyrin repeat domain-containing protein [Tahibacter amnicola]UXI68187.1 ankyrin repeat domain-containing protein [Tahibacter amnicola]
MRRLIAAVALVLLGGAAQAADTPSRSEARKQLKATNVDVSIERLVQYSADGDAATVELLIAAGVSPRDAEPKRRVTPLHNAAAQGHERLVRRFLELGADVNATDWQGNTPLINASYHGRAAIVDILLGQKARTDVRPDNGPTALIAAVHSGSLPVVEKLLAAGADARQGDAAGHTPLAVAERTGRKEIAARLAATPGGQP